MSNRRDFFRLAAGAVGAGLFGPAAYARPGQEEPQPIPAKVRRQSGGLSDWHAHWAGPTVVKLLSERKTSPRWHVNARGEVFNVSKAGVIAGRPQGKELFDIDARLRHLDEMGVERQILSWNGGAFDGELSAEESQPIWRAQNDDLAALIRKHPRRFSALATLPTGNPQLAAAELERGHKELGLIGATLPLDAFVSLAGARFLAPIFEAAQRHRSHIYIHRGQAAPNVPGQQPEFGAVNAYFGLSPSDTANDQSSALPGDHALARVRLGVATRLALGVVTLALTDFLDAYPDVTVQAPMIGGSIPVLAEHIDLTLARQAKPLVRDRWRRVYLDVGATGRGPHTLELAVEFFGADRILLGSDYAPVPYINDNIDGVLRADITDKQRRQIFVENGRQLLARHGIATGR